MENQVNKVYCEDCRHVFKQGMQSLYGLYIGTEYSIGTYYCGNSKTTTKTVVSATPIFKERSKEYFNECAKINKNNDCPYFKDKNAIALVEPEPVKEGFWYRMLNYLLMLGAPLK